MSNSLQDVYGKALRKAVKQYRDFLKLLDDVNSGKVKPPQFYVDTGTEDKWRKGFLTQQLRKQGLIEKMGAELDKAGGDAAEIIQDSLENTYKGTWHKQKTIFEQEGAKVGIKPTFSVLNTRAIERAVDDSQQHSPFSKISINNLGKNTAVRRRLQNEMAQSIALGESKSKLIKRLRNVAGNAMYNATRVAQTETTRIAAQARNDAAGEVVAEGARVYKKWICHIDGRERTSHHELNGMAVMYDKDFKENLAIPGDPRAPAGQVCNCRCTIVYHALLDDEELVDGVVVKVERNTSTIHIKDVVFNIEQFSQQQQRLIHETFGRMMAQYPLQNKDSLAQVYGVRWKYGIPYDMDGLDVHDYLYQVVGIKDQNMYASQGYYFQDKDGKMKLQLGSTLFGEDGKQGIRMADSFQYIHNKGLKLTGSSDMCGFGPQYALVHEYGHILAHDAEMYGSMKYVGQLADYYNENKGKVREQMSGYATKNWNEMFAQAFAQSFSPYQSDVSKQIMDIYRKCRGKQRRK